MSDKPYKLSLRAKETPAFAQVVCEFSLQFRGNSGMQVCRLKRDRSTCTVVFFLTASTD